LANLECFQVGILGELEVKDAISTGMMVDKWMAKMELSSIP